MYLSNTIWLIADRVLRLGVLLLVTIYLARYLGPGNYGELNYILSFVGLFSAAASLGVDGIVIRDLVARPEEKNSLLGTAVIIKFAGAIIVTIIVAIGSFLIGNPTETILLMLVVSSALLLDAFNVIDLNFQARVKSRFASIARMAQVIVSAGLKVLMVFLEAPLEIFVYLLFFDALLLAINYIAAHQWLDESILSWRFDRTIAARLFEQTRYLIFADLIISLYLKVDKVMLKELVDEEALGLYAAACTLSEAWYFIPMAICSSLYPMLIEAKSGSATEYRMKLQQLYNLMVWLSFAIIIPVTFLGTHIMTFLFGEAYRAAGTPLSIHIWSSLFVFLGVASGKWLLIEKKYSIVFGRAAAGLCVNILLNLLLIPRIGLTGAALATLLSQAINGWLYDIFDRDSRTTFNMKLNALLFLDRTMFKLANR